MSKVLCWIGLHGWGRFRKSTTNEANTHTLLEDYKICYLCDKKVMGGREWYRLRS